MPSESSSIQGQHNLSNTQQIDDAMSTADRVAEEDANVTTDAVLIDLSEAVNEAKADEGNNQ